MPELTVDLQSKVNDIISYILDSSWAMGWDPKPTDLRKDYRCNPILLKLDLLGRFSVAANSEWFTQALKLINEYTDESGIYHFPKS